MSNPARPPLSTLSPLKMALLAQQTRADSAAVLRADPIAIVGMGCRLPGGVTDPKSFWEILIGGVDAVREVPADRWDVSASYDPDPAAPGKSLTKYGGFLDAVDGFDADFFGILPREAERMDPQQRLFLEVAIEALDHAGLTREGLAGSRTGVFIASYYNDYALLEYGDPESIDARTLTGTVHSVLANRLSYFLDLRGPSVSVDTACSSSLVAVHMACQSLRHGESDIALAGGVSLIISDALMVALSKVGFMAPDGRCKTFDASADGFGRGEGCGVIVLKRLADAIADGDRVLALIRGSAVNQDGRSTLLAAPNGVAQEALVREALANAQLEPSRIGYVEAHGTGTPLGDPIEVEAIAATVGTSTPGAPPCYLGTAKANLGHLEAAAGVTGLIKSVLVLQHGAIPPQVHFRKLNPHISLDGTRLRIPTAVTPWPRGTQTRCIGTSGFGVGGTNAHVILEEAPPLDREPREQPRPAPYLLPLSAESPDALRALVERWVSFLPRSSTDLAELCAAAGERRSHYDHRFAAVGSTVDEMLGHLRAFLDGAPSAGWSSGRMPTSGAPRLAFVFGGQGQQWLGMGRELLEREPVFRDTMHDLDRRFRTHVSWSLLEELAAPEGRSRLDETEIAQPLIFAIQVALTELWASWGFTPAGVVGHSIGEIAALYVAGVLSLDDAVRVVAHRGRVMQRATGHGAMAAVALDEAQALEAIRGYGARLSVGAINSPRGVVLSGERAALDEVLQSIERRGVSHRRLPVDYAFHSEQMQPLAAELTAALGRVAGGESRIPLYSTVTGALLSGSELDAGFFGRGVRQPVRFAAAIDAMLSDGFTAFLEIGAHPVLSSSIAESAAERNETPVQLASLRRGRPERETMLLACAGLYCSVRSPEWEKLHGGPADVVDLPAYPWQHRRYWLRPRPAAKRLAAEPWSESLGRRIPAAGSWIFEASWPGDAPAWLADHRVRGRLIMPAMAMLESLRAAAVEALGVEDVVLSDFVVHQPLVLDEVEGRTTTWQVVAQEPRDATTQVALYVALDGSGPARWQKVAEASASSTAPAEVMPSAPTTELDSIDVDDLYASFAAIGVDFGPAFRTIAELATYPDHAVAWLQAPAGNASTAALHPAVLDGALQTSVAGAGGGKAAELMLPMGVSRFRLLRPAPAQVYAEARVERDAGGSLRADIVLRDRSGDAVAELAGVSFVPAGAETLRTEKDSWLHEIMWERATPSHTNGSKPADGAWLLLVDRGGTGEALANALKEAGQTCRTVSPEDPGDSARLDAVLADAAWRAGRPLVGVVHLWSLDDEPSTPPSAFDADDLRGPISMLHLVQAMARHALDTQLVAITRGAVGAGADAVPTPTAAGVWGFANAATVEHPELAIRVIDLDADAPNVDASALAAELRFGRGGAPRLALRSNERLEPRMRHRLPMAGAREDRRLRLGADRTLESLRWEAFRSAPPAPGHVRVRVVAAGINFRDVLLTLGMYPGAIDTLGAECAGVVEAVGEGVLGLAVGDRVFGFVPNSLADVVTAPQESIARWDDRLGSLEIAAGLPVAFLTAMYGLLRVANVGRGQRVLIHAGAGGVGMAAVQLARRAGADVFATAGSPAKRALLRTLGVDHVFDSRSTAFAEEIREVTKGRGVDVVLNSLAGEFITASVDALSPRGCFLELGKRGVWTEEEFRRARPEARYCVYDLGLVADEDRSLVRSLLDELLAALRAGTLRPLPVRTFEFEQAPDAFRLMAQGRHVGKLVLRAPRRVGDAATSSPIVRGDATYWVTGGLGALGLHTARWLAGLGAKHIVLTSRRQPDEVARRTIEECEARGASVHVRRADTGDADQLRSIFDDITASLPPLRGVVHAAGALDDGVLLQQSRDRFTGILRGKAHGARTLDSLTRDVALDFFVLYSAAGTWLGPAGQAAYAAANAELDAIAQSRRARGLPALSVAWGLWEGGGMATAMAARGSNPWSERGLGWIDAEGGMARLERLLREGVVQANVLPIDWGTFLSRLPSGLDRSFFARVAGQAAPARAPAKASTGTAKAEQWRQLPESQRRSAVQSHVAEQALAVLGLGSEAPLDPNAALKDAGLDSLMAVELRNSLARSIGTSLPATLLFDYPSLSAVTDYLMRTLKLVTVAPARPVATKSDEVVGLSEQEAEAQLLAELGLDSGSAA